MFHVSNNDQYTEILPGIWIKTQVYGEKSLLSEFHMKKGSRLPDHSHPHEQTGYLVSGKMRLTVEGETLEAAPGDSWCVPGNARHHAEMLEDTVAIEVFSPVREEYLVYHE
jgi:quercetin dioxygenase-like cupin family protein